MAFAVFCGLCLVALAIYEGLNEIASAIAGPRAVAIDVRLPDPIHVAHRSDHGQTA